MRTIDSNPSTSTSIASLTNKTIGKNSDALLLSEEKVLTAGESWKGKQVKLMGKAGIKQEKAQEYTSQLTADNKRAKEAVYAALKEKYPDAIDYAAALKINNKEHGYHGLDDVSGVLQMSSDVKTEKGAILTCGEVRSLFDTAERLHQENKAHLRELAAKAEEKRLNPAPDSKADYERMLEGLQRDLGARNLDEHPHPTPKPVPEKTERLTYNLDPKPFVDTRPKEPLFSPQERAAKQPDKLSEHEARLYDGAHAQEQYRVSPRLLNHKRALAFANSDANLFKLGRELKADLTKLTPERFEYVKAKLLTVAHKQANDPSILKQEMTRGEIRSAAKDALAESLKHDKPWCVVNTGRLKAAENLTGTPLKISNDVRTLVKENLDHHKSFLDTNMMSVFADLEGIKLTRAEEKIALKATKNAVTHIISSEMRSMTSQQVEDVARDYIRTNFGEQD